MYKYISIHVPWCVWGFGGGTMFTYIISHKWSSHITVSINIFRNDHYFEILLLYTSIFLISSVINYAGASARNNKLHTAP